jgi:hypothetical protein
VGFEPTLEFPLNTLSKRAPSATRPSLRRNSGKELLFSDFNLLAKNVPSGCGCGAMHLQLTSILWLNLKNRNSERTSVIRSLWKIVRVFETSIVSELRIWQVS